MKQGAEREPQGFVHVYCGDGKGKTTAAVGLTVRALGAGWQVVFLQCMKSRESAEHRMLEQMDGLTLLRCREPLGFFRQMTPEQKARLRQFHDRALGAALEQIRAGRCQMLVLDEITHALNLDLIDRSLVGELLAHKPPRLELVLTGRDPDETLRNRADYLTEMRAGKHPYAQGVPAREGIEY